MLPLAVQNKNIFRLAAAQALAGANSVVFYATGAIVGNAIAPSPSLATLPITLFVLGMAASILPFGALARTRGRKAAFRLGTGAGMVTGLAAALAVVLNSFLLFCLAAMLGGAYAAVALSFRFAATDGVAPARRARALSLVMGGGVAAGIIGPMLVTGTMHLWPAHTFAVTFLAQALVAVLAAFLLRGVTPAEPTAASVRGGRPLREIVRQPGFATTVFSGAVAYMVMNFLMTAAPLSMHMHGLSQPGRQPWDPVACDGDVRPGIFHRPADPALRRSANGGGGIADHRRVGGGRSQRSRRVSLLAVADFARHRLELWLHRRLGENHRFPPPGREDPGSVAQRFSGLRRDDRGVVFVRGSAQRLRLERRAVGLPGPGCGGVVDPAAAPLIPIPRLAPGLPLRRPSFAFFSYALLKFI